MPEKSYSKNDLKEIAREIMDSLRPKHLRVCEIKEVFKYACELTECIVLREKME